MSRTASPASLSRTPYRAVDLPPVRLDVDKRDDGSIRLRCRDILRDFDPNIPRSFFAQVERTPDKALYAQRRRLPDGSLGDWNRISFEEAGRAVASIGQWLLDQGLGPRDTVMIITGNSIAHALMRLGALAAGVCACPISANYAVMGGQYERLRYVIDLVKPQVIFAETAGPVAAALQACDLDGRIVVSRQPGELGVPAVDFNQVLTTTPGDAYRAALENINPDEHAVYMLTSGSTGMPKAVIQTQRMLSTNMHQASQFLGTAAGWGDVMLDWLPWSHVSGAFNLLAASVFGGTLYIDEGKPAPGFFHETLRNLREISLPYFCNVPAGYAALIEALESDEVLRKRFFHRLKMLLYGGAGLPQPLLDRLQKLAVDETGCRVFMTSGYGATESTSACMAIYFDTVKAGIGLPLPGLEVKLVPDGDRYEVRLRGDNVTPGYLHNPEGTVSAFDEEGFYRTGDAARFHDDANVNEGLYFAGRLAEEFKLGSGTWVYAGQVRARLVEALAPTVSDVLLCGIGHDYLAALGVPNLAGLREISGQPAATLEQLVCDSKTTNFLQTALKKYNAAHPGGSTRIMRFAFMRQLPSAAHYELSDKGTLNQSKAAESRGGEIAALYAELPAEHVITA